MFHEQCYIIEKMANSIKIVQILADLEMFVDGID